MSNTFSIICEESKSKIWIGQGGGDMTNFYTGEPKTMGALKKFLNDNQGKCLKFVCDGFKDDVSEGEDYKEYD